MRPRLPGASPRVISRAALNKQAALWRPLLMLLLPLACKWTVQWIHYWDGSFHIFFNMTLTIKKRTVVNFPPFLSRRVSCPSQALQRSCCQLKTIVVLLRRLIGLWCSAHMWPESWKPAGSEMKVSQSTCRLLLQRKPQPLGRSQQSSCLGYPASTQLVVLFTSFVVWALTRTGKRKIGLRSFS